MSIVLYKHALAPNQTQTFAPFSSTIIIKLIVINLLVLIAVQLLHKLSIRAADGPQKLLKV